MNHRNLFVVLIAILSLSTFGQDELTKIRLAVHWLPQAQFAGYYSGIENGIYEKHGFDVEIIHSSANVTAQELLLDGKADFASMFLTTAISLRSNNEPLINVCQLSQRNAQVLVTRDTNITEPEDLNGKKIGVWRSGFDEVLKSFVDKYSLDVEYVLISSTINLFLFGGIDVMTTMWYNEYHSILSAGINKNELNTFFFADYGFDIPEDGIYTVDKKFDKETITKFVNATLEAWDYAFTHKDEAIKLVEREMKEKNMAFNKPHQRWMLDRLQDLFNPSDEENKPGVLSEKDFNAAYDVLSFHEKINTEVNYEDFYYGVE